VAESSTDIVDAAPTRTTQERRTRILQSTVHVVRQRGFAGTRVTDIAEHANTSAGLVLYHFGSLQGALTAALTAAENSFYTELERVLEIATSPVVRLRSMAELAAGYGPAVGDWVLWLELWVRALRDPEARATRESLDHRWRAALGSVVREGLASGDFTTSDPSTATMRLASLMDGLAIQLALGDPGIDVERFRELWLESAALELGAPALTEPTRHRASSE
jgi:AcrR family transcriptional regulator